jgi:hypothetical protein
MAIVSILTDKLTGKKRGTSFSLKDTVFQDNIPDFFIDVTLTEAHQSDSEPTENPVEEGVTITDHIDLKPLTFTMTGVVSDSPLDFGASIQGAATVAGGLAGKKIAGPLGSHAGVAAGAFAGLLTKAARGGSRTKNAFDYFRDLQSKRVPFTVITGLHEYRNMVITSLTANRDNKTGNSFNFSATLKQIRVVKSREINVPNTLRVTHGAGSQQDLGKKSAKDAKKPDATLTLQAFRGIGNLFKGGASSGGS